MRRRLILPALILSIPLLSGCSKPNPESQAPPEVEVVQVIQKDVPVYGEWIGTLDGMVNAEIKAQVSGYLVRQTYVEGSVVTEGQPLFEIDSRTTQALLEQAKASVAQAEGNLAQTNSQLLEAKAQVLRSEANRGKTQLDVNRYLPLAKEKAITEQELDNAVQGNLAAQAEVEAAKARVESAKAAIVAAQASVEAAKAAKATAELNLGFTKIISPIAGVAGVATAQIGNFVRAGGDTLTTVSTMDPIKAYFTVSEQEYLHYVRADPDAVRRSQLDYELFMADGSVYPHKGKFFVADREVNPRTGTIRVAGIFPNPGNVLRPGQYGRVRAVIETRIGALLVPQRAVTDLQGAYQVAVVGSDSKVRIQAVKVGDRVGSLWVITEGLSPSDVVVAEGTIKVRAGLPVSRKPFNGVGKERSNP